MLSPFLNPWILLALPAVGIPVLIHLLNRHRATIIEWGAMELLRKMVVIRSRQIRLEDIILMVLRCLIVLLIVLAAARLTTSCSSLVDRNNAGLVVAIDGSLSMTHRPGLKSRFEEAMERARTVIQTVEAGQPISIVLMGPEPRVLLRHTSYDPATLDGVLAKALPSNAGLDLDANLIVLKDLVSELKSARRELHVITDGQVTNFARLSDKTKSILREIARSGAATYLIPVSASNEENCTITDFRLISGVLRTGALAQFQATVRNAGRSPQVVGDITLMVNGQAIDRRSLECLSAGQSASVRFTAMLAHPGINRFSVRINNDALTADNTYHAVVVVKETLRVLCVDGDPMERNEARSAFWVKTALAPTSFDRTEERPLVELVPWTQLGNVNLVDFDTVVLVNPSDFPTAQALALRKYVEQGGALILMPGANLKPNQFNKRFLDAETSVLPAEMIGMAQDTDLQGGGVALSVEMNTNPIAAPLAALPNEMLAEARCYQYVRVRLGPDSRTVLRLANDAPLLIERKVGRGSVLLWTTSIDPRWSNLMLNPAFPILMQQSVTQLNRQSYEFPITIPNPISLSFPLLKPGLEIEIKNPDGQVTKIPTKSRGLEVVLETPPTEIPGYYELKTPVGNIPITVAVNPDPVECDVRVLNTDRLTDALNGLSVHLLDNDRDLTRAILEKRQGRELWIPLLLAVIGLLALEAMLARRFTKRA